MLKNSTKFKGYTAEAFDKVDLAYFAGFLEADGFCSFYVTSSGFLGNVGIEQKDRSLLEVLQRLFGGKINLKTRQQIWVWQVFGLQAKAFLQLLRPYFKTYRVEKFDRFIAFFSTVNDEERIKLIVADRSATEGHRKRLSELASGNGDAIVHTVENGKPTEEEILIVDPSMSKLGTT